MAIYAPKYDYEFIKSQNPYADINLYRPGTTLSATDIALGGAGAEAGVLDENLGGAKRLAGLDRTATANEYYKYLANQPKPQPVQQQPVQQPAVNNGDPLMAIIGSDPEAMAYYNQAKQAAQLGSRNAMETLNERGILNSSVTGDTITGLEQQAMTNILPQIFAFQEQKRQQTRQDAYNRMNMLGYADNEVSKVLGIPVGTPSADFSMQEAGLTGTYQGKPTLQGRQAEVGIRGQELQNESQSILNQFLPQIQQGQIDGIKLQNNYQALINVGLPQKQAAELAATYANISQGNAQVAISKQNADTSATRAAQDNNSIKMNDLIQRLNNLYTVKDQYTGAVTINPDTRDQLEAAILGQQLSDEDTKRLLAIYGFAY